MFGYLHDTGSDLVVSPVTVDQLHDLPSRCWPDRQQDLDALARHQEILGVAAWDRERCVGQLHCYKVQLPDWDDSNFPSWTFGKMHLWPLGWPLLAAREAMLKSRLVLDGPVWGHACFHVGYTLKNPEPDSSLFGCGIGSSLATESVNWARSHGYSAVLALGGPADFFEALTWMGVLPWTTYARMGFRLLALEEGGKSIPWWAKGGASPEVVEKARHILAKGRPIADICFRVMLLEL